MALIVTSPAFIVIYIMIKHEDGGPAIFKQERIGQGGKPFTLYKFRSMVVKSESDGKPALCQKDDMRLTKVGNLYVSIISMNFRSSGMFLKEK